MTSLSLTVSDQRAQKYTSRQALSLSDQLLPYRVKPIREHIYVYCISKVTSVSHILMQSHRWRPCPLLRNVEDDFMSLICLRVGSAVPYIQQVLPFSPVSLLCLYRVAILFCNAYVISNICKSVFALRAIRNGLLTVHDSISFAVCELVNKLIQKLLLRDS